MTEKDYSLEAFNRFMDYAALKGILKKNTAQSRKAATNKILKVLDEADHADLRKVDVDEAFDRFQNIQGTSYRPDSLQVYKSRTKVALTDFFAYAENPSGFKPASTQKARSNGSKNQSDKGTSSKRASSSTSRVTGSTAPPKGNLGAGQIVVPVPLRDGVTVEISNLPTDLTESEAARLAAIVQAYAVVKKQ